MNHKHRVALNALFTHPVSNNINLRVVKSTLEDTGAEISHGQPWSIDRETERPCAWFSRQPPSFDKHYVAALRKFLTLAGGNPARDYRL